MDAHTDETGYDATPSGGPRRFRLLRSPRTWVALVALALVAVELFLGGVLGYGNPRLIMPSARGGYRMVPGQVVAGVRGADEHINSRGYREREWGAGARQGLRAVVLGDSVCYGVGVEAAASWPKLLEAEVEGLEVLSLCVPGYTVEQMVVAYEEDGRALEPDLVLVELSAFSIRSMRLLREPARYPLSGWIRRSALWDWVRRVSLALPAEGGREAERSVLRDPYAAANESRWQAAERRLDGLREELRARGARLVLVPTPNLAYALEPAREGDRWRAFAREREDVTFVPVAAALAARIGPLVAELDALGLDGKQLWKRARDPLGLALEHEDLATFFLDDPQHLDPAGHRVVAGCLARALEPLLKELEGRGR